MRTKVHFRLRCDDCPSTLTIRSFDQPFTNEELNQIEKILHASIIKAIQKLQEVVR